MAKSPPPPPLEGGGSINLLDVIPDEIPSEIPAVPKKKCYKMSVVDEANFPAVTLGGHTFQKESEPIRGFDKKGHAIRAHVDGLIEELSDEEVTAIQKSIAKTIVRSYRAPAKRDESGELKQGRIVRVEVFAPTASVPYNPETDEPVKKYLRFVEVERPSWWARKG